MLPEALAESVRAVGEASGGSLLLDAARGRAILTDNTRVLDVCRSLKRAGFTSCIDFTGMHNGGENFTLFLTLRAPAHNHSRFTLKWKWTQSDAAYNAQRGAGQPGDKSEAGSVDVSSGAGLQT
nr:hypothetical protein [bacterium]